jgi:hypothetical protein
MLKNSTAQTRLIASAIWHVFAGYLCRKGQSKARRLYNPRDVRSAKKAGKMKENPASNEEDDKNPAPSGKELISGKEITSPQWEDDRRQMRVYI